MHCYDCQTTHHGPVPAVAVCRQCGAAVCADHARTAQETLHRAVGMGVSTLPKAARRITCTTCRTAETSR
uniref:DUF2180 family protein n=1 Tax=Streptomyces sp. F8 TaxID=1436085 RepID=UPI0003D8389C|nr:DUF2180 family protein [Streptomyces sp. F8]AHE39763.1 Hypothetical protein pFRL5_100c [Streptomyces sp. F8]